MRTLRAGAVRVAAAIKLSGYLPGAGFDARVAALVAAAVALLARLPFLVVVLVGAAAPALLRAMLQ